MRRRRLRLQALYLLLERWFLLWLELPRASHLRLARQTQPPLASRLQRFLQLVLKLQPLQPLQLPHRRASHLALLFRTRLV